MDVAHRHYGLHAGGGKRGVSGLSPAAERLRIVGKDKQQRPPLRYDLRAAQHDLPLKFCGRLHLLQTGILPAGCADHRREVIRPVDCKIHPARRLHRGLPRGKPRIGEQPHELRPPRRKARVQAGVEIHILADQRFYPAADGGEIVLRVLLRAETAAQLPDGPDVAQREIDGQEGAGDPQKQQEHRKHHLEAERLLVDRLLRNQRRIGHRETVPGEQEQEIVPALPRERHNALAGVLGGILHDVLGYIQTAA